MEKQINAHEYESIYTALGINLNTLGCVMKDIKPMAPDFIMQTMLTLGDDVHLSDDPEKGWVNGLALADGPHITLLYGLLINAHEWQNHVEYLLEHWTMPTVTVESIGHFDSPFEDEPYYCIVAHIKLTAQLLDAHHRLEFLPHVNTYSSYKPHLTLAYVKKNEAVLERMTAYFKEHFEGKDLDCEPGLNLGDLEKHEDKNTTDTNAV